MNRYERVFASLKSAGKKAFIPFAVAGDPDIRQSERIFKTYIDCGADILEIGYPFSDPIADGPVNQRAAQRAIASGLSPESFFNCIGRIRAYSDIPIGLLLYTNTVLSMGANAFCRKAADAGVDSMLIADMPPEESELVNGAMRRHSLGRVFIVSELTPDRRMRTICDQIDSFVYIVSRLGTTGTAASFSTGVVSTVERLRKITRKPLAIGFGISTPGQVREACAAGADAVIVGSAFVKIIETVSTTGDLSALAKTVGSFKRAMQ